jgi:hypothetical protein
MFEIGKCCSPSAPPVLLETKIITVVKMSCGGGMGGSCWYEYGKPLDPIEPNKIIRFRQYITGNTVMLNTNFLVKAQEKKVAKIESDCTRNTNFHNKSRIDYWLMDCNAEFRLVDRPCVDVPKKYAENIHSDYIY